MIERTPQELLPIIPPFGSNAPFAST